MSGLRRGEGECGDALGTFGLVSLERPVGSDPARLCHPVFVEWFKKAQMFHYYEQHNEEFQAFMSKWYYNQL